MKLGATHYPENSGMQKGPYDDPSTPMADMES
jgi:hypothetical protein